MRALKLLEGILGSARLGLDKERSSPIHFSWGESTKRESSTALVL